MIFGGAGGSQSCELASTGKIQAFITSLCIPPQATQPLPAYLAMPRPTRPHHCAIDVSEVRMHAFYHSSSLNSHMFAGEQGTVRVQERVDAVHPSGR